MGSKITVVLEMKDGSLFPMRQEISGDEVKIYGAETVDRANIHRIAGNYLGWGPIPPIPDWTWHHSWAPEDHPANSMSLSSEEVGIARHLIKEQRVTVVLEMNDGALFPVRSQRHGDRDFKIEDLPDDEDKVRRIAGGFRGWGSIPPIPDWIWHHSFGEECSPLWPAGLGKDLARRIAIEHVSLDRCEELSDAWGRDVPRTSN